MDNSDKELKTALDEVFGDDIIELDANDNEKINLMDADYFKKKSQQQLFFEKIKLIINKNAVKEEPLNSSEPVKIDVKETYKRYIMGIVIIIAVLMFILFIVSIFTNNDTKVTTCTTNVEEAGYKISEEYKVSYVKNKIKKVEGKYNYIAKTDDFKKQVEVMKNEKVSVLINSNGINGFKYDYEFDEKSLTFNTILNYDEIDFNVIKNVDQIVTPISFITIDKKRKFNQLEEELVKKGFTCVSSK